MGVTIYSPCQSNNREKHVKWLALRAPYSPFPWRILTFTGWNGKYHVMTMIQTDLFGFYCHYALRLVQTVCLIPRPEGLGIGIPVCDLNHLIILNFDKPNISLSSIYQQWVQHKGIHTHWYLSLYCTICGKEDHKGQHKHHQGTLLTEIMAWISDCTCYFVWDVITHSSTVLRNCHWS